MNWLFRFLIWTVPPAKRRRFFDALITESFTLPDWQRQLMLGWLVPIGKKYGWMG